MLVSGQNHVNGEILVSSQAMRIQLSRKQWGFISVGLAILAIGVWALWPRQPISVRHVGWEKVPQEYYYHVKMQVLIKTKNSFGTYKDVNGDLKAILKPIQKEIDFLNKLYEKRTYDSLSDLQKAEGAFTFSKRENAILLSVNFIKAEWKEIHLPIAEVTNHTSSEIDLGVFLPTLKPKSKVKCLLPIGAPPSIVRFENQINLSWFTGYPQILDSIEDWLDSHFDTGTVFQFGEGEVFVELSDYPDTPMWRGE